MLAPKNPLVIIVEDNAASNQLFQEWLNSRFRVAGYIDAESAQRLVSPSTEKIVFLVDYNLPGENGIAFKKNVETDFPQAKFILASGLLDAKLSSKAKEAGFHDLLPKPFNKEMLIQRIDDLLK